MEDAIAYEENSSDVESDDPVKKRPDVEVKHLDFKSLSAKFVRLLAKCGRRNIPLIIFIDNLDLISSDHNAKLFKWLPIQLPRHVKIVLTVTGKEATKPEDNSKKFGSLSRTESLQKIKTMKSLNNLFSLSDQLNYQLLDTLEKRFNINGNASKNVFYIPPLHMRDNADKSPGFLQKHLRLSELISCLLKRDQRCIDNSQLNVISEVCEPYPQPLAAWICVAVSREWGSQKSIQECFDDLPLQADCIDPFVHCFFRHLENRHGRPLVAAVASYITISLHGLSCSELLSLLSYDKNISKWLSDLTKHLLPESKTVLKNNGRKKSAETSKPDTSKDTKKNFKSQNSKTIHSFSKKILPEILWHSLQHQLSDFLVETLSDEKLVLRWKHVVFGRICMKR